MKLLKEYIRLIIKEELEEDINIEYLSSNMIGIYAFAQAINKLIYEGNALPGSVPIDIIDAGVQLKSAPMTTKTERIRGGMSFQYSGNSFKLYLNPTLIHSEMNTSDETHDLVHAFTANIAKAFGRRRQSVEKSGRYKISPSRFNKITIDRKVKDQINNAFEKEFGFRLPEEAFTKPFTMKYADEYSQWFMKEFQEPMIDKGLDHSGVRTIALDLYGAVAGTEFAPGLIGKKYYARYPDIERAFSFAGYIGKKRVVRDFPFGADTGKIQYKQSAEDEEELGNVMTEYIAYNVTRGLSIDNPDTTAENILRRYSLAVGLTGLKNYEFKHRYDTPEVKSALIRLFKIYNTLLDRYHAAQEYYNKKQFPGVK